MPSDGGFESDLVHEINDIAESDDSDIECYAYRRKQHRFSSQDIDVLVDSRNPDQFLGVECKSKQIDPDVASRDSNVSAAKLYFKQGFSVDKDGNHQIDNITEFLRKTQRKGALAIAYRRGPGRPVHYYALGWDKVVEKWEEEGCNGLTRDYVIEHGKLLYTAEDAEELTDQSWSERETDFSGVFDVATEM